MNHSVAVLREDNSTSSIFHFIPMDAFLATNHVVCNLVGLPLNLLTTTYIVLTRRMHQTRNILWLGVAFSNMLILVTHLVEFYAYQFQCETAQKIIIFMAGLPYASLMLNLFFSLLDRYISVAHSAWYKRNVNITWIASGQIGCFAVFCVLMKGHYLLEIIPIPSGLTITEIKIVSIVGSATLLLCVIGYIFVYVKVASYLRLDNENRTKGQHYNYTTRQR